MLRLKVKGKELLARSGEKNVHRLSLKAQVSYPTIDRMINRPEALQAVDTAVLAQVITAGLGLTPEQVLEMPMSSFFEFVDSDV